MMTMVTKVIMTTMVTMVMCERVRREENGVGGCRRPLTRAATFNQGSPHHHHSDDNDDYDADDVTDKLARLFEGTFPCVHVMLETRFPEKAYLGQMCTMVQCPLPKGHTDPSHLNIQTSKLDNLII